MTSIVPVSTISSSIDQKPALLNGSIGLTLRSFRKWRGGNIMKWIVPAVAAAALQLAAKRSRNGLTAALNKKQTLPCNKTATAARKSAFGSN
jgi:hypothetical protein